ncbi:MAG: hypothetical protein LC797_12130 [Chloroflexi bacterium]|nr:hypothetical protein [Chloroflexota bacterium]
MKSSDNKERSRALEEATSANHELEAFSYAVSHDLRAPLRAIDGFSQALLEDYADRLDAGGQEYLQRVRAASQRMGHLIDDLLRLSRLKRTELSSELVDLSGLAMEIASQLDETAPERLVEWSIQPAMVARGDPELLRILLANLLGNAFKFTSKTAVAKIGFSLDHSHGSPEFSICDNGAGFDMVYADRLFGPFQRLHSTTEFEGTGIGLATVQRIIQRHRGTIRADSRPGLGATFCFTLGKGFSKTGA